MYPPEAGSSPDDLRHQAQVLVQGNNLPAARTLLEALVARSPTDLLAHLDLAHVLMTSGSFRASAACLADAATRVDGASPASLIALARRL